MVVVAAAAAVVAAAAVGLGKSDTSMALRLLLPPTSAAIRRTVSSARQTCLDAAAAVPLPLVPLPLVASVVDDRQGKVAEAAVVEGAAMVAGGALAAAAATEGAYLWYRAAFSLR